MLSALAPLDEGTRRRVLGYVQERFGVTGADEPTVQPTQGALPESAPSERPTAPAVISDIRTLKEKKQPKSAVEMAVLVSYYVSDVAKPSERKNTIGTADITKYFKQADYPLPSQPRVILHRAKNAGYLDSADRAQYKLNPVGHNLVAHGLPRASGKQTTTRRRAKGPAKRPKKTAARAKARTRKKTTSRAKRKTTGKKR